MYRSSDVQIRDGVAGNARLTGAIAAALLVLLAAEGATIPFIGPLLGPHIFIGLLLIPPVLLKLASTGYRFARYYTGSRRLRRKGPAASFSPPSRSRCRPDARSRCSGQVSPCFLPVPRATP